MKGLDIPIVVTPTLTLPPQRGRGIPRFPDENELEKRYSPQPPEREPSARTTPGNEKMFSLSWVRSGPLLGEDAGRLLKRFIK